ncbi:MAG: sensor histidine kinase [Acidiferrobacterales bacterium]
MAEGTRAVAQGNYSKRLPVTANDELGVLVSSFNEMTLRIRQAQNQIRRSQHEAEAERTYLETVLTHLSSGVLSFDARQRLRTHNTSAAQILGTELKECAGKTLRWLAGKEPQLEPFFQTVERASRNGRSEWHDQVSLPGYSGQRILIVRGTMLPDIDTRRGGHVVVFDDITAVIQAQRDAAWSEVARRLAHEIKNPLTPIQLAAERIRHKCMDSLEAATRETLDRATRIIVQQVEAMKTMVDAFADYARPVRIVQQFTDVNVLVRDVTQLYLGRPDNVRIDLDLDEDLPRASADPDGMRQVLHNLMLNAHEALTGTPRPRIIISTRRTRLNGQIFIEMRISDNGPGFAQSVRDRLFEPYVTTKKKGTGLGLAIVKKIVEEHGGVIAAENPAGSGSCLVVWIPAGGLSPAPARARKERTA